jgi:hypothetical protein
MREMLRVAAIGLSAAAVMAGIYFGTIQWQRSVQRAAEYEQSRLNSRPIVDADAYRAATNELWKDK